MPIQSILEQDYYLVQKNRIPIAGAEPGKRLSLNSPRSLRLDSATIKINQACDVQYRNIG